MSPAAAPARIAAIIPVGTAEGAKTRLAETLDAEERHELVDGFLARTVVTALAVTRFADVLVVSPDRELLERATGLGARTLRQRSRGLRAGLADARADVVAGGATAVVVLPIDLPFVSVAAVDAVVDALLGSGAASGSSGAGSGSSGAASGSTGPTVVLVTDRHGTGTNALGLRPPGVIDFAFGPGSRAAHRERAAAARARYVEVDGPLTVDLDTPEDLVFVESVAPERLGVG
jgi:2-phospho-L-lactate guanylyltransferase